MNVHIVLDSSALLTYLSMDVRSVAIGELMAMVEENDGIVGVPALCVLDAHRSEIEDRQRVRLEELPARADGVAAILPLLGGDTVEVARMARQIPTGQAHAIVEARRYGAMLATCEAGPAKRFLDEDDILDL
jgi:hypothetical protein